jgi:hypothetical protein
MPDRFPLVSVPTNDPFCEEGFCASDSLDDGDGDGGCNRGSIGATGFPPLSFFYSVLLDKNENSSASTLVSPPGSFQYCTQDRRLITASFISAVVGEYVVGKATLSNRTVRYVGDIKWAVSAPGGGVTPGVGLTIDLNYALTFNTYLFNVFTTESDVTVVSGAACFNIATLQCNDPPFTGQTYGQALPGYEAPTAVAFGTGEVNNGSSLAIIGDRYEGAYDFIPPLPHRPWFQSYVNQNGATFSTNPAYEATRSAVVRLVPVSSVKVSLMRGGDNTFALSMDQQAVGGVMVLRYSAGFDGTSFIGGFYGPTVVYIPKNKRTATFTVRPGLYASIGYTVTLEVCFGLPNLYAAQFWPLAPDPIHNEAYQPPV